MRQQSEQGTGGQICSSFWHLQTWKSAGDPAGPEGAQSRPSTSTAPFLVTTAMRGGGVVWGRTARRTLAGSDRAAEGGAMTTRRAAADGTAGTVSGLRMRWDSCADACGRKGSAAAQTTSRTLRRRGVMELLHFILMELPLESAMISAHVGRSIRKNNRRRTVGSSMRRPRAGLMFRWLPAPSLEE